MKWEDLYEKIQSSDNAEQLFEHVRAISRLIESIRVFKSVSN
ncbi:hypothetical protein CES85_0207 [Ochrobactrum quorumnocens]|uniref:Uncharacterized protein n=1 Tax=Ochrobactrum quorumnocens TaxID=271865 RepID=A0A248UIY9_9HYPH|nr:hypothetical protein CES85_0207 [[Ochrobactrum] quorumnocens]